MVLYRRDAGASAPPECVERHGPTGPVGCRQRRRHPRRHGARSLSLSLSLSLSRFATDYRIVTADSPDAAMAKLDADAEVAVAMAGQSLTDTTGVDCLGECHQIHPAAKRLLPNHLR